jgi:Domain of unknown function (DUF1844)
MSTLWTPGGERPIRRDPPEPASGSPGGSAPPGAPDTELTEEEVRAQMEQLREQLARTPAEVVIANHAFGLFELAALHLSLQPAQLDQARLAIDALAALVDTLGSRLGDPARQLSDGLSQLRMAYVEIHKAAGGGPAPAPGSPAPAPGSPAPAPGSPESAG